ncbi:unnamed protein product [Porites evermanni]|uniref:EGF-like domain-containing protein n=1 Tax=Porites evermanni TaxID=104178 RepID=A0ABN8SAW9_9CNID|nr:unnamed protein product [Porites evermanni]
MISEFSYPNISSIGQNLIQDENDCGYACLEIPSCFSYNLAAFPDVNGKLLCELLPSDKFNNSDKLNASKEFHHFYIPPHDWPNSYVCVTVGRSDMSKFTEGSRQGSCPPGFAGNRCEIDINGCENILCLNNGTCTDRSNGLNCSCPPGFSGNRREININECKSSPCLNNATCTDRINAFNCSFPPGFSGNRCEIDINECRSNPCLNNGTCNDRINRFNCSCPAGFAGKRCEIEKSLEQKYVIKRRSKFSCEILVEAYLQNSCLISFNLYEQGFSVVTRFLSPAIRNGSHWGLCWQASTHGWAASTFHNKCDGKRHTIIIIKKDQYVFGG